MTEEHDYKLTAVLEEAEEKRTVVAEESSAKSNELAALILSEERLRKSYAEVRRRADAAQTMLTIEQILWFRSTPCSPTFCPSHPVPSL